MGNKMKTNTTDLATAAQEFFAAYDARDVEGMIALCADGAQGRYAPYGRERVVPIRGGIDVIWRAFPQAIPNFRVKVIEMIFAKVAMARTMRTALRSMRPVMRTSEDKLPPRIFRSHRMRSRA